MEMPNANMESNRSLMVPVLICTGIVSVICSMFISNYVGMGLAICTIVAAVVSLKNESRTTWNLVIAFSVVGFFLGFSALLMKVFLTNAG